MTNKAKTCKYCDSYLSVVVVRSNGRRLVYHFCKRCDGIGVVGYLPCGTYTLVAEGKYNAALWKKVQKPGHEPRYCGVV